MEDLKLGAQFPIIIRLNDLRMQVGLTERLDQLKDGASVYSVERSYLPLSVLCKIAFRKRQRIDLKTCQVLFLCDKHAHVAIRAI